MHLVLTYCTILYLYSGLHLSMHVVNLCLHPSLKQVVAVYKVADQF